ncbi:flavodoxin family protein [Patescibacteria group bacterium]|jgi:putative NADPH-quinone reductase|nr:flavodoxin family protein [Patescibacteria group bacterium]
MDAKKVLIVLGHPDTDTYTGELADTYERAAREAGHDISRFNLGEMHFDPILHRGYKEIQELEPDLVNLQNAWRWCDHVVIVYPNWWNTMPALLKGMFDRMWLPGFAFNFNKQTKRVEQHLKGKTARVIIVAGTNSAFSTWWSVGDYSNEIRNGILRFSGHDPVCVSTFGPSEKVSDERREHWKEEVARLGKGAL